MRKAQKHTASKKHTQTKSKITKIKIHLGALAAEMALAKSPAVSTLQPHGL